ncbi:hypothetical protein [uncultured Pseudacidovorax sp.]|uniref:hypothetical protein n=1 Tax=uncultured Pseudacidovorax sp. TaxID=679313 RepID=UPI0025DD1CD6|nr:hypothetical protein [uncultured Pseudacidovorax sp.]
MTLRPCRSIPRALLAVLMAGTATLAAAQAVDNRQPGPFERAQQQRYANTPSMRAIQQGADFNTQQPPPPVVPSQPQWRPHRAPPVIVYEDSRYAPWGNAPPAAPQPPSSRQDTPTIWYGGPLQQ